MAELVYAFDLKSNGEIRAGSIPALGTIPGVCWSIRFWLLTFLMMCVIIRVVRAFFYVHWAREDVSNKYYERRDTSMCSDPKNFNKEEVTETGVGQLEALKEMINPDFVMEMVKDHFEQNVFGDGDPQCLIDALRVCAEDDEDTNVFRSIDRRSDAVDAIFEVLFGGPYKDAIVARAKEEWPEEDIGGFDEFLDVVCVRSYLYEAFSLAADGVEAATAEGIADPKPVDEPTETK